MTSQPVTHDNTMEVNVWTLTSALVPRLLVVCVVKVCARIQMGVMCVGVLKVLGSTLTTLLVLILMSVSASTFLWRRGLFAPTLVTSLLRYQAEVYTLFFL